MTENDYCLLYDIASKRITELEKENAELQERYNKVDIIGYDALKNLAKAKDIIKELIKYDIPTLDYVKAEQFLKGENIILEDAQVGNSPFDADEVFNKEIKAYPEEK